jgi:hypothetical protein
MGGSDKGPSFTPENFQYMQASTGPVGPRGPQGPAGMLFSLYRVIKLLTKKKWYDEFESENGMELLTILI